MQMQDVFWSGFADEIEKLGAPLPDWYTEPIRVSASRIIAGHPGQGGIVSPGGIKSTRGFPSDVGENYSVSESGAVYHKGPRKMREHKGPPLRRLQERARSMGSPLERLYDKSGLGASPDAIQGAGSRAIEAVKRTPSKPAEQASNP